MNIVLKTAVPENTAFILEAENHPDNKDYVAQWSLKEHKESLENRDRAVFIITDALTENIVGYTILTGLLNPEKSVNLRRLVITGKGKGYGRATLEELKHKAFDEWKAHRLWLDVRENNSVARRLYKSCGFVEEGLLRDTALVGNTYVSAYIMSILDREYFFK